MEKSNKRKAARLWKTLQKNIRKYSELGGHGGILVALNSRVQACGSLGPALLQEKSRILAAAGNTFQEHPAGQALPLHFIHLCMNTFDFFLF